MRSLVSILGICLIITSCGEHAAKGAGEGAAMGAASGAVGGLVSALVFGGDPAEAAARGAVYGGAVGATSGAISGSRTDAKIAEQQQARQEKIRSKIGDDAFSGLTALIDCKHQDALQGASRAMQSNNPNHAVSGRWLEILSYADMGNNDKTGELMPGIVEADWEIDSMTEAKANLFQLQDKLAAVREEYKLPANCE
jgi:hypothetical protein